MTSIVMCDDHRVFSEALCMVLESRGYVVAAIVATGSELLDAVADSSPDLCLLDLHLPDTDGLALLPLLRQQSPRTRVLVVSGTEDHDAMASVRESGAVGFVHKDRPIAEVVAAVAAAAAGDQSFLAPAPPAPSPGGEFGLPDLARFLTPRERESLERMVRGQATADIARYMNVSYATARTHIQNTLMKLGVHSKLEAVAFAVAHNVVPLPGRGRPSGTKPPTES